MPRYKKDKRPPFERLLKEAVDRGGLFTTSQAEEMGISRQLLSYHEKTGKIERVAYGIYRSSYAPESKHEDVIIRVLAAGPGSAAAGPTVLDISDIGNLAPDKVYVIRQPESPHGIMPSEYAGGTITLDAPAPFNVEYKDGVPCEGIADAITTTSSETSYDIDQINEVVADAKRQGLLNHKYKVEE